MQLREAPRLDGHGRDGAAQVAAKGRVGPNGEVCAVRPEVVELEPHVVPPAFVGEADADVGDLVVVAPVVPEAELVEAGADAVLAASVFHFQEVTISEAKEEIGKAGYSVRR